MRQYAGHLRAIPLCGYLSLTRVSKAAAFNRLLEAEGVGFNSGQPWPLHLHIISATCSGSSSRPRRPCAATPSSGQTGSRRCVLFMILHTCNDLLDAEGGLLPLDISLALRGLI